MFKKLSILIILAVLLALPASPATCSYAEYTFPDDYYRQFIDSDEPLSVIEQSDMQNWAAMDAAHPILSQIPSPDRIDYFDVAYGTDPMQKLDIHHKVGSNLRPVIIFIHGGGWVGYDKDSSRYAAPTWIALGYTVVSINYRLAPWNPHPAQIEDCARALKWVIDNIKEYGGDPDNIAIVGNSAGGHLTALLATGTKWQQMYNIDMKKVKCWIPISGVHDMNFIGNYYHPITNASIGALLCGSGDKNDASPVTHITGNEPPCLIVHGGDDWLVPNVNSTELYTELHKKKVKAKLKILDGYRHVDTLVNYGQPNDEATKLINKFLEKYIPTDEK